MSMKTKEKGCIKCTAVKAIGEFYKHSQMADGHLNKCKACTRLDSAERRAAKPEQILAYDRSRADHPKRVAARRSYQKTVGGREALARAKARWSRDNKNKRNAHVRIKRALEAGTVVKAETCWRCGLPGVLVGHHPDYAKPLEVQWVHDRCHKVMHREMQAEARSAKCQHSATMQSPI